MDHWQSKTDMQKTENRVAMLHNEVGKNISKAFEKEDELKKYLDFRIRIPEYSVHNMTMIRSQRPDAQFVGSYQYWREQGLYVRSGEHGMLVLTPVFQKESESPVFKTGYVFDITQTNASSSKIKELCEERIKKLPEKENYRQFLNAVIEAAEKENIHIIFSEELEAAKYVKAYPADNTIFLAPESDLKDQSETAARMVVSVMSERMEGDETAVGKLRMEMALYMLLSLYGLGTSGIPFQNLSLDPVKKMSVLEKKKIVGESYEIVKKLSEHIDVYLERQQSEIRREEVNRQHTEDSIGQRTLEKANTRPDNEIVRVARRTLEKQGADWKNGKPLAEEKHQKGEQRTDLDPNRRIEDFGKKIGGARKDIWKKRGLDISDIDAMTAGEATKYITKENIWTKPDYMQMIREGVPVRAAYFIKEVRNALPAKVKYSHTDTTPEQIRMRQEDYISLIRDVREQVLGIKSDADICRFFDDFVNKGIYVTRPFTYLLQRTEKGFAVTNRMLRVMQMREENLRELDRKIEVEQFGRDDSDKLPRGYTVRQLPGQEEYVVLKGKRIVLRDIKSHGEAVEKAKELKQNEDSTRKKRFVPEQLAHIKREGPSNGLTPEQSAEGVMYMEKFGFAGGEFGNWMTETDRRASLDMGYDALCDLAVALEIDLSDIALDNHLSIAFGARGRGKAAAHYEPDREVINLTKMSGAGSLAHEWGHAFDDIIGKKLGAGGFMTANIANPKIPAAMRELVQTMKKRPATEEEKLEKSAKEIEKGEQYLEQVLQYYFPEKGLDNEAKEKRDQLCRDLSADAREKNHATEQEEREGRYIRRIWEKIGKISRFKKEVTGHVITKEARESLYYAVVRLESAYINAQQERMVETDFYKNSVKMDAIYSREDKGYWHSEVEMFARAFACYVHDKLPWRSDYLCGHSELAVAIDFSKPESETVRAIPEGKERERINQCFDKLFQECRSLGLLKGKEDAKALQRTLDVSENFGTPIRKKIRGR